MNIKNTIQKLRDNSDEGSSFFIDLAMLLLLVLNLFLLVFDWFFAFGFFQRILADLVPNFFLWYKTQIHGDTFFFIDMIFVSIFLTEFMIRWIVAVYQKRYHSWVFYPFIHWYDLLGCIPLGSFRFLRLFRIFAIIYRLHKMTIIDLKTTVFYQTAHKYFHIITEEFSDKVVIHTLTGLQQEIHEGTPVMDKIVKEVILPKKPILVAWLSSRIANTSTERYAENKEAIQQYIEHLVTTAVAKNQEVKEIERIPMLGDYITKKLNHSIYDISFNVIHTAMLDLASSKNIQVVEEAMDLLLDAVLREEEDSSMKSTATDIIVQSLEVVKEQVMVQQWKKDLE